MLDLQRHMYCPIWTDATAVAAATVQPTESPYEATTQQWTGLKYACQKVLETYCKLFDEKELYDLIVRYTFTYNTCMHAYAKKLKLNILKYNFTYSEFHLYTHAHTQKGNRRRMEVIIYGICV